MPRSKTGRSPGLSTSHSSTDRKSTRLNSSHLGISYAVFCLKKKKKNSDNETSVLTRRSRNSEHNRTARSRKYRTHTTITRLLSQRCVKACENCHIAVKRTCI